VLGALLESGGGDPAAVAKEMGFEAMASDALSGVLDEIIASHPDEWARYLSGDEGEQKKLAGLFTGQVMKATAGKANGKDVAAELQRRRA
jgi:Asp-tRNA(Asn)/Glu-tRNA(Gln) amidotransferase B subunit